MVVPWSALGITPPAPGAQLHAEIAITSWDRERWMSLSGLAPDAAMDHPEAWRADAARQRPSNDREPALVPGAGTRVRDRTTPEIREPARATGWRRPECVRPLEATAELQTAPCRDTARSRSLRARGNLAEAICRRGADKSGKIKQARGPTGT